MLEPISNTIQGVINFTWPMILISMVIMISFRLCYIVKNKEEFILYKELMMLIFAVYILCLFQVVTFQDNTIYSSNNFIPFKEIMRYNITSRLFFKNVLGNMILFMPFGFFTSYYLKVDKSRLPVILTIIASISIECVQMCIGRVFDVDDIILNLVGGYAGFTVYNVLRMISEKLPSIFRNNIILNILAIILLVLLIIVII